MRGLLFLAQRISEISDKIFADYKFYYSIFLIFIFYFLCLIEKVKKIIITFYYFFLFHNSF